MRAIPAVNQTNMTGAEESGGLDLLDQGNDSAVRDGGFIEVGYDDVVHPNLIAHGRHFGERQRICDAGLVTFEIDDHAFAGKNGDLRITPNQCGHGALLIGCYLVLPKSQCALGRMRRIGRASLPQA